MIWDIDVQTEIESIQEKPDAIVEQVPHFDDDIFISQVLKTDPEMKGEEVLIGNTPVIATIQPTNIVCSKLDQTAAVEA